MGPTYRTRVVNEGIQSGVVIIVTDLLHVIVRRLIDPTWCHGVQRRPMQLLPVPERHDVIQSSVYNQLWESQKTDICGLSSQVGVGEKMQKTRHISGANTTVTHPHHTYTFTNQNGLSARRANRSRVLSNLTHSYDCR